MINLLPPEVKSNYGYARRNTKLLKWSFVLLASIALLGSVGLAGQLYLQRTTKSLADQVEKGNADLQAQKLDETQKQVEGISNDLKLVVQVLSKEVLFSSMLKQIGSVMPPGAVLTELNISKLQGGLDLQAAATDYQTATQVQVNIADPKNKLFASADIVNIQCGATSDAAKSQYPCTVQIRALFAKQNPFLFITKPAATP